VLWTIGFSCRWSDLLGLRTSFWRPPVFQLHSCIYSAIIFCELLHRFDWKHCWSTGCDLRLAVVGRRRIVSPLYPQLEWSDPLLPWASGFDESLVPPSNRLPMTSKLGLRVTFTLGSDLLCSSQKLVSCWESYCQLSAIHCFCQAPIFSLDVWYFPCPSRIPRPSGSRVRCSSSTFSFFWGASCQSRPHLLEFPFVFKFLLIQHY
jgi:hypothetical protein